MTAEELMARYSMQPHVENGAFVERHYAAQEPGRAASGAIYYYVAAGERTAFHRIDCDEYWCMIRGEPLELWQIEPDGELTVSRLGTELGCEPLIYLKKGVLFASRHCGAGREGAFLACITVPRFTYEGFQMLERDEVLRQYPQTAAFFDEAEADAK